MSLASERQEALELTKFYKDACIKMNDEVCQVLGKAVGGFPYYKDDQKNFPGATEKDGICYGEHTCESMADYAAHIITEYEVALRMIALYNSVFINEVTEHSYCKICDNVVYPFSSKSPIEGHNQDCPIVLAYTVLKKYTGL